MKTSRLTIWAGAIWAAACLVVLVVMLFGFPHFEKAIAGLPFMKVSDKFAGGPVLNVIEHGAYKTEIHEPVFPALIGQGASGFVQVNWTPLTNLPPVIHENIDCSSDGHPDFTITVDIASGRAELVPHRDGVLSLQTSCALSDSWVVRVNLDRMLFRQGSR